MESKPSTSSSIESQSSQACLIFEFHEILSATDNFDESLVIGHGGFGKVYRGLIFSEPSLVVAAIKRLDSMSSQGATEFWAEVEMLSKLRHCNLVSLFGYCNHEKEMIRIYEYMPNGTLEDHLHKRGTPISWLQRLKICISAARWLDYLHTGTGIESGVIHRDIKTSNILLHKSWAAKISDFGLSRIGPTNQPSTYVNTLVRGTFGYPDPNYFVNGKLTRKSDVYAFGVVLLEVLCRKRAVNRSLDEGLGTWAQDSIKEGNLKDIIDSEIRGQISTKCLKDFVRIAKRCLESSPKQRPKMAEVVVSLDSILTLQEKVNGSLQAGGETMFGRIFYMFAFPSIGDNSASVDSKLSSKGNNISASVDLKLSSKGNNINTSLNVLKFVDLKRATRDFSQDLLLNSDGLSDVFLGWVDKNTFVPSTEGIGIAVAVKRYKTEYLQYGKEETFFDSQAWLDSDYEDDFMSVNGEFTSSRGNTPVHHSLTLGTKQGQVKTGAEPAFMDQNEPVGSTREPSPTPTDKKMRLLDLFKESVREEDHEHNEETIETPKKDGLKSKSERVGTCFSNMLYVRGSGRQKKKSLISSASVSCTPVVG